MSRSVVTSFWGESRAESDPLRGHYETDVAIIGGGLAGMSTAYHLKRAEAGLRVAIFEQTCLGYGASGRNFGNVPHLARSALHELRATLGDGDVKTIVDQQTVMLAEYEQFLAEEKIDCDYERVACLLVAHDSDSADELEILAHDHQEFGFPSVILSAAEASREAGYTVLGGLSCGWNGYQNPLKLVRGFRRALRFKGVEIFEGSRCTGVLSTGQGASLSFPTGNVTARDVVIASDAYSSAMPGFPAKVLASYTYAVATRALDPGLIASIGLGGQHRVILDHAPWNRYFYMQLRPDGRILFGGAGARPMDTGMPQYDDPRAFARVAAEMSRRFPAIPGDSIELAWGGPLGMTCDGMPVMREVEPHIFINVGFNGRGALMAAMSGRIVAPMVLRPVASSPEDLAYQRYARALERASAPRT